jgi:hypothetical protein
MQFIIHRVNAIKELKQIPKEFGCEIDIRADGSKLILNHDPFHKGDYLIDYLDEYKNGTLILNIKESGIEDLVLKEVKLRNIKSYFLLDVEFPYLFKAIKNGEKNIAVRFSEKEPIENAILFQNKLDWVWVDTLNKVPINKENIDILNKFKVCLVCPTRWGRIPDYDNLKEIFKSIKTPMIMTSIEQISNYKRFSLE